MVRGWQLWLSPRPTERTETPADYTALSANDGALYEFLYEEDGKFVVRETHYADNKAVQQGHSGPPLHIHLTQTEYFKVEQGTLAAVLNEKLHTLTKDDGLLKIVPGTRHRFWAHESINGKDENLIFKVWAEPQDVEHGFDENYLRNALGYLRDCASLGLAPSIFQMALLGWSSDTLFICPPFYVPIWILKSAQFLIGNIIGKHVLGYQASYPEWNTKPRDNGYVVKKAP